jgi:hypothetical protein
MRMCSGRRLWYCAAYSGCVGTVVGNCAPSSADRPGRFALVRHKRRAGGIDLEMNLAWELHRHFEWLRLSSSSIVELTSCAWGSRTWSFINGRLA